jgi:uncharacterized protein (TIGR02145 family)
LLFFCKLFFNSNQRRLNMSAKLALSLAAFGAAFLFFSCSSDDNGTAPPANPNSSSSVIGEGNCAGFDPNAQVEHYGKKKYQLCDERDGKRYAYVTIPPHIWMAENLNYDTADGTGSWCYNDDPKNCESYGRLYNAPTAASVCPPGWHFPDGELLNPGYGVGSIPAEAFIAQDNRWSFGDAPTDEFGFSMLPGGLRTPEGTYVLADSAGALWNRLREYRYSYLLFWPLDLDKTSLRPEKEPFANNAGVSVRCYTYLSPHALANRDTSDFPEIEMVPVEGNDSIPSFSIGKYEVTQGEWNKIMGINPSYFADCGNDCPVERVSFVGALDFIAKLNARSGKNYRLPTKEEWLLAAGSGFRYAGSDDYEDVAWVAENADSTTHPVGKKQPNQLGIYDMSGNVLEWIDAPKESKERNNYLALGGAWLDRATDASIWYPNPRQEIAVFGSEAARREFGFRVALSP